MKKAPYFELEDQNGKLHTLDNYAGEWLVLYFYPKDGTPGCTLEACAFRDGRDMLHSLGAEVVGISKDSVKSHDKFVNKHSLNFTILSDPTAQTAQSYGSWGMKKFMGKKYEGVKRDTFIINPEGEIIKKFEGVNPIKHFEEVYETLKELVSLE